MLMALAGLLAICAAQSAIIAWLIGKVRPAWSERNSILLSAAPVPVLVLLLCALLFVRTVLLSRAQCGTDACGMAMVAALIGAIYAISGFGLAVPIARYVGKLARK